MKDNVYMKCILAKDCKEDCIGRFHHLKEGDCGSKEEPLFCQFADQDVYCEEVTLQKGE